MQVTLYETEKLLTGNEAFSQLGFAMLLARLKELYGQDSSPATLQRCADEINAFFNKFRIIMSADYEKIKSFLKSDEITHVMTFDEASELIRSGKLLHIAGTGSLLRRLPEGNWIGGSTEYFIGEDGGKVSDELLFITEYNYEQFTICDYDADEIYNVANEAFDNGFTILILPFDSQIHIAFAENAATYENMFMRNIVGWVAGVNLGREGQIPITVNGLTTNAHADKAVALHMKIPDNKSIRVNAINIFTQDDASPVIEFMNEGFSVAKCMVDGHETVLADYIAANGINTKLPLIGDYSGNGVNISYKSISDGVVNFYAPVFKGIKYRFAKDVADYAAAFREQVAKIGGVNSAFSCNCILNFLYGELEGKMIKGFVGPITFGEIAYQLLNQTLVYVTVTD